jgi:cyclic pyranopterin phosphate synthase
VTSASSKGKRELTHLDAHGHARMVDVGEKEISERSAVASAVIRMAPETMALLRSGTSPKGDVIATARIAGIQAAKRTPELIPLCHAIALTSVRVEFQQREVASEVYIVATATATARDRTGVEMEALTAASIAALTIYDMLKAVDRGMAIVDVRLERKTGGRSGDYQRE